MRVRLAPWVDRRNMKNGRLVQAWFEERLVEDGSRGMLVEWRPGGGSRAWKVSINYLPSPIRELQCDFLGSQSRRSRIPFDETAQSSKSKAYRDIMSGTAMYQRSTNGRKRARAVSA